MSSNIPGDQKVLLRPSLAHNAATVIPTLRSPPEGGPRARAGTSPERFKSSTGIIQRRRADTSTSRRKSQLPHLGIRLPEELGYKNHEQFETTKFSPSSSHTSNTIATAPIAIPQRKEVFERPSTPLSGRPNEFTHSESIAFQALKEKYGSRDSETSSDTSTSPTHTRLSGSFNMGSRHPPSKSYRPSSPLSHSRPVSIPSNEPRRTSRHPQKSLNLAGLPKFHPANFSHADSSAPLPTRSSRGINSQPRANRHGSDAQQKLQQYQREVVAGFTRLSYSNLSQSIKSEPESPRLAPRGSPGDPMTPLMLENDNDYLMAGSGFPRSDAATGREMVENLLKKENESRKHPEARPGSLSPAISPSIGPAVSPAGGSG